MEKQVNVVIAGVGGQGVILMSELLGNAAVRDNLSVRGSEVLGMAVRGGSVYSNIRIGDGIYGPLTPIGRGDVIVGMEPAEALRNISYLSPTGIIILNREKIVPFTVALGQSSYPSLEAIMEKLTAAASKVVTMDATQLAIEAGSQLSTNVVMLGALFGTGLLQIKTETVKKEIESRFNAKVVPLNLKAFDLGYQACQQGL